MYLDSCMLFVFLFPTYFTLEWQTPGSSTSLQMTQFHSFSWLNNIPLYLCTTLCICATLEAVSCRWPWPLWSEVWGPNTGLCSPLNSVLAPPPALCKCLPGRQVWKHTWILHLGLHKRTWVPLSSMCLALTFWHNGSPTEKYLLCQGALMDNLYKGVPWKVLIR